MDKNIERILLLVFGALIGFFLKYYLDNRKRKKDFYSDTYKDIWMVVQNVTGIINRGRLIDHDKVMELIHNKYSCRDINAFLLNCPHIDDPVLTTLLQGFSKNLSNYQSEKGRLQYPTMGDGQVDYQRISNDLTMKIKKRIDRYLTK